VITVPDFVLSMLALLLLMASTLCTLAKRSRTGLTLFVPGFVLLIAAMTAEGGLLSLAARA